MKRIMEYLKTKRAYEVIFCVLVFLGFVAWVIGLVVYGADGKQMELFFDKCSDFFADIVNPMGYSAHRNVYTESFDVYNYGRFERAYPPISYVIAYGLSRIIDMQPYFDVEYFLDMNTNPQLLIVLMIAIIINMLVIYELIKSYKAGSNKVKVISALLVCVSMPVLFTIERANLLLLTMVFIIFYIFNYDSDNKIKKELALMSLALAASFKITPAVLGILLLYNKQWKEAVRAVIYGIIFGFVPFLFFEGGFNNIAEMFRNASLNLGVYPSDEGTTLAAVVSSFGIEYTYRISLIMKLITYVIAVFLLVAAVFYNKKWETIMAVTMVLLIVPSHSGYYCILYILPALIAFLNEEKHSYADLLVLAAMVFIMNDYQCYLTQSVFNYHMAIVLILAVLLVRGIKNIIARIKLRNVKYS